MAQGVISMTEDTGWQRISNDSTAIGYKVLYRRIGKTVYIKSNGAITGLTENTPLGYLSADCRPDTQIWFPCYAANPVYKPSAYLRIYAPGGGVTLGLATDSGVTASTSIYVSASYLV